MSERQPYKTDLSDEQWALVEPVIAAWKAAHRSVSGHKAGTRCAKSSTRSSTGCQWDLLPHDLPPRGAVMYYFTKGRDDGTDQTIHDLLRWQVREKARRKSRTRAWWCSTPRAFTRRPGCRRSRRGVMRQKSTGPQARPGR
ncbi:transposase [Streptomyces eurythermus]